MAKRDTPTIDPAPESAEVQHEHHSRLLEGMAKALAAKGYANITIADIVREAAVSRRSFYEHFATKADCLLALYESASEQALVVPRDIDSFVAASRSRRSAQHLWNCKPP